MKGKRAQSDVPAAPLCCRAVGSRTFSGLYQYPCIISRFLEVRNPGPELGSLPRVTSKFRLGYLLCWNSNHVQAVGRTRAFAAVGLRLLHSRWLGATLRPSKLPRFLFMATPPRPFQVRSLRLPQSLLLHLF